MTIPTPRQSLFATLDALLGKLEAETILPALETATPDYRAGYHDAIHAERERQAWGILLQLRAARAAAARLEGRDIPVRILRDLEGMRAHRDQYAEDRPELLPAIDAAIARREADLAAADRREAGET